MLTGERGIIEISLFRRSGCKSLEVIMPQPTSPLINLKSRSGQVLPYALFGAILFIFVSSTHLNQFFSAYLILLAAQLGTLGIYLISRRLKSRGNISFDSNFGSKSRQN
jgi:hypothetical protein